MRSFRGMTLIDIVVGVALMLMIFVALAGVLRASLLVSGLAKAKASAVEVGNVQMEYLRSLSYDALGTSGGIPSGSIPQTATTTENAMDFVVHTFISYVDDAADGTGASDSNGITTDYKRAHVAVSYTVGSQNQSVDLVSNFAPPGVETTNGGGTLAIAVVNAVGSPVSDANVLITNASTNPTVSLSTFTDTHGTVSLPGAATSSQYQVAVSLSGYSSAQTYTRNGSNPNPNPGYLTVAKAQTTTGTFAIDLLSTFLFSTFSPIATTTWSDSFINSSQLAVMSSTTVSGGALTLSAGTTSGFARSIGISSSRLVSWGVVSGTTNVPAGASLLFHIYDGAGTLLPDAVLSGNAVGFSTLPINLYTVSTSTYPTLSLGADFAASGSAPSVSTWSLSYREGPLPLPSVSYTVTGAKSIGTNASGAPIYKTIVSGTTNASGTDSKTLEWDAYQLTVSGYDIEDTCPSIPYALSPGGSLSASVVLGPTTSNALRVLVSDNVGVAVSGATVTLSRSGFSKTVQSSSCGNAYFGSLSSANDYSVMISKSGYTTQTLSGVSVSGQTVYGASFP